MTDYRNYITINTEVRFGRPTVIGTRIAVYDVLNWLAKGMSQDEILTDYPELSTQQILACLSYAAEREHNIRVA